jgi:hypothetical protein
MQNSIYWGGEWVKTARYRARKKEEKKAQKKQKKA